MRGRQGEERKRVKGRESGKENGREMQRQGGLERNRRKSGWRRRRRRRRRRKGSEYSRGIEGGGMNPILPGVGLAVRIKNIGRKGDACP
jgi:hypothetical protein